MSGEADSDDDYMSDNFLKTVEDVRPGLAKSRAEKRKIDAVKAHEAKRNRPVREIEAEQRAEGLEKAVGADNRGYNLLLKMGYRPGSGLGQEGRQGRLEPIGIQLKNQRTGVGLETAVAGRARARQTEQTVRLGDYRAALSARFGRQNAARDMAAAQRACYQCDAAAGYTEPAYATWFWPSRALGISAATEPEDGAEEEKDERATVPKRNGAVKEANAEEEEEYYTTVEASDAGADDQGYEEVEDPETQLMVILNYLRTEYHYCIYCGTKFEDVGDMETNCPGLHASDHDV